MKSLKFSRWLPSGRTTVIGVPFLFLFVFFLLPFLLVVGISFSQQQLGIPPYTPLTKMEDDVFTLVLNIGHYKFMLVTICTSPPTSARSRWLLCPRFCVC